MKKNVLGESMTYLGEYKNYQLYRNSEGFIEGFRSIGLINTDAVCREAKDLKRVVSNVKTVREFLEFIRKKEASCCEIRSA